jgi:hypothetical protein
MCKSFVIRGGSVFLTTAAAIVMLPAGAATAQLIAFEAFDIPADQELGGKSGATSTGWDGNWLNFNGVASGNVTSGSLARPTGTESFSRAHRKQCLRHGPSREPPPKCWHPLPIRHFAGGQLPREPLRWLRFGFNITFNVTSNCCGGGTTISFGQVPNSTTENNGNWAIPNGSITQLDTGNSFTTGVDAIVLELTYNVDGDNDLLRVWFDTDPHTQPPTFSTQSLNFGVASERFIVGFNSSNNFSGSSLAFDELRVGRTLGDVTIPEPGTRRSLRWDSPASGHCAGAAESSGKLWRHRLPLAARIGFQRRMQRRELGAAGDAELLEDVAQMRANRAEAHAKLPGDIGVLMAGSGEADGAPFRRRESGELSHGASDFMMRTRRKSQLHGE